MAGRRRAITQKVLTGGLSDYGERMGGSQASDALNVEFTTGGVRSRRGSEQKAADWYQDTGAVSRDAAIKVVKTYTSPGLPDLAIVGLVPKAGAEVGQPVLQVCDIEDGSLLGNPNGQYVLSAAATANGDHDSRWDACLFTQEDVEERLVVICTDHLGAQGWNPQTYVLDPTGIGIAARLAGVNRKEGVAAPGGPFHRGLLANSPDSDDSSNDNWQTLNMAARFCRTMGRRLVLGYIANAPVWGAAGESMLWVSNRGDLYGWPSENLIPAPSTGDTSEITGLGTFRNRIVVFRRRSVSLFWLNNDDQHDPIYREVIHDRGCVAHGTIVDNVQGMTCFMSTDGFYGFNGTGELVHLSKDIDATMRSVIGRGGIGGAWATHYPFKEQVWIGVPAGGEEPGTILVMDYGQSSGPAWSIFQYQNGAWADGGITHAVGGVAVSGDGSRIYGPTKDTSTNVLEWRQFNVGVQDNGNDFRSRWESAPIDYGKGSVKRLRYIRPTIRPSGASTVTCWWRQDAQATDYTVDFNGQSTTFSASGDAPGGALGSFVLGTDRLGGAEDHQVRLDVHTGGLGRTSRVGFQVDGLMQIRSLELDVYDRMRVRR